ncbi:MAG: hypothetical protein OER22_15390 [Gammaproteobacteria bacterium]|nr:hypothetical protein [Gammaproteobacteria bacterium]MDH3373019.1 hypothetical protein [Gammaproteobacteria bacterium]MDH3408025.1 hypothetical protein [Gammaproteobacteria bacterium]MDH3553993.1 hypothetical protein [Gammaproteobacteria bacterium]
MIRHLRKLLPVFLVLFGFAAGMAATSPLDPVRAAPHIYEVAFETERVRVLRRTIRNGETSPLVEQPDRVVVYLNPCAWLVEEYDGSKRMESFKFGTPVWAPAETHGGKTASVIQQCSVIEIELK